MNSCKELRSLLFFGLKQFLSLFLSFFRYGSELFLFLDIFFETEVDLLLFYFGRVGLGDFSLISECLSERLQAQTALCPYFYIYSFSNDILLCSQTKKANNPKINSASCNQVTNQKKVAQQNHSLVRMGRYETINRPQHTRIASNFGSNAVNTVVHGTFLNTKAAVQVLESHNDQRFSYFSNKIQQLMRKKQVIEVLHKQTPNKAQEQENIELAKKRDLANKKSQIDLQMYLQKQTYDINSIKQLLKKEEKISEKRTNEIKQEIKCQNSQLEERIQSRRLRSVSKGRSAKNQSQMRKEKEQEKIRTVVTYQTRNKHKNQQSDHFSQS